MEYINSYFGYGLTVAGRIAVYALLEFASSPNTKRPNNLDNLEHPKELDVTFLETLSESYLQYNCWLNLVLILMKA